MPRVWVSTCSGNVAPFDDHARDFSVELRASRPVARRLSLEGRAGLHGIMDLRSCTQIVPPPPEGRVVTRAYPSGGSGTLATDLRLRYEPAPGLVVAGGGGWLWGMHAPYAVVSPGFRVGGRVRFLLDGDLSLGRFPYDLVVTDWHSGVPTEISHAGTHEWRSLGGIRMGCEVGFR